MPTYFVVVETAMGFVTDGFAISTYLGTIGAANMAVKRYRDTYEISDTLCVHVDELSYSCQ